MEVPDHALNKPPQLFRPLLFSLLPSNELGEVRCGGIRLAVRAFVVEEGLADECSRAPLFAGLQPERVPDLVRTSYSLGGLIDSRDESIKRLALGWTRLAAHG
jgi:hypothetical protein